MFLTNDVYQWGKLRLRILWTFENILVWIDIDNKSALPQTSDKAEFEHLVADEVLKNIDDPFLEKILSPPSEGSRAEQIQKKAWAMLNSLVNEEPWIYRRKQRGELIAKCIKEHKTTKQTIYRYLRRYWQLGKSPNALSAIYENCGGKGKQRKVGRKKRGRRRTMSLGVGVNVDENIQKIFRVCLEQSYINKKKYDFAYAHNQVLIAFGIDPSKKDLAAISEGPTLSQLHYFFNKEYRKIDVTKSREGEIDYLKDFRPVLGTSTAEVEGPGTRFQIDATIGDIYLVSSIDRRKIIGRPVIYIVVDVFSRLIVGFYVGLEGPSWVSAMESIASTVRDKQELCAEFDIQILPEQWSVKGLPESILGDKGEMLGRHVEVLSKSFNVRIENTPSFRADWKGIVERYFRTIQTKFKPYVQGYVEKKPIGKKRNGPDYRLDATLTLYEFTQVILRCVIYYNNDHVLSKYDPPEDMPANLEHNPRTLWEWGVRYRTGKLRCPPEDLVKINLLPHTEASITEKGILLFKCYYACAEALRRGWFERNYHGPKKIMVAYDPHSANQIYIRPNNSYDQYWTADLSQRSREYRDYTIWDVWEKNEIKSRTAASSSLKKKAGELELDYHLNNIAEEAKTKMPDTGDIPKSKRVAGIRQNRLDEKTHERSKKAVTQGKTLKPTSKATVLPFNGESSDADYEIPDMTEDLYPEDGDD